MFYRLAHDTRTRKLARPLARLRRHSIDVHCGEVTGIDTDNRQVDTIAGVVGYDRLVIALGAELALEAVPGFADAAHNFYRHGGATTARDALRRLTGGRVAVVVARPPYKCPAGPWEAALLAEAMQRRRGNRARSSGCVTALGKGTFDAAHHEGGNLAPMPAVRAASYDRRDGSRPAVT